MLWGTLGGGSAARCEGKGTGAWAGVELLLLCCENSTIWYITPAGFDSNNDTEYSTIFSLSKQLVGSIVCIFKLILLYYIK